MSLTPKQEKFAVEYVRTGNASEAYRLAFPASLKWMDKSVWENASAMLARAKVKARVMEIQASIAEKAEMSIADWVKEVKRLSVVDARSLMHPDGRMKLPHELDSDTAAAIASFKVNVDGTIEYKFWDKNAALEKMGKHLGAYEKDNAQKPPETITEIRLVALRPADEDAVG